MRETSTKRGSQGLPLNSATPFFARGADFFNGLNDAILFPGSDFHSIRLCILRRSRRNKPAPAKPAAQAPQAKQELKMETVQLAALIKSAIMALQHANQTGNYSVPRDLGTPVFRERFDLAQLTAIFSNLRSRSVNLSPVLFLAPNLTKQPEMTEGNQLRIVGDFQTQPLKIQYERPFRTDRRRVAHRWTGGRRRSPAVHEHISAAVSAPPAKPMASNQAEKKIQKMTN